MSRKPFKGVVEPNVRSEGQAPCCKRARKLWVVAGLLAGALSACAQTTFEITPLVGGRFNGTFTLQQEGQPNRFATMGDSLSCGVSGGFRFDGDDCESCSIVGFRWMRQGTHLALPNGSSPQPSVTLNHFLGDFTREFPISGTQDRVKPFVMVSLGGVIMSTPVESAPRFEFGFGGGINAFPKPRWGFRLQVEYLPIVKYAGVQNLVCGAGGCVAMLYGGVMNQFVVSAGPIFRF